MNTVSDQTSSETKQQDGSPPIQFTRMTAPRGQVLPKGFKKDRDGNLIKISPKNWSSGAFVTESISLYGKVSGNIKILWG